MKISLKLRKKEMWIMLCLLGSFSIDSLPYILPSYIASICNTWIPVLISICYLGKMIKKKRSLMVNLVLLFFLYFLCITAISNIHNLYWLIIQSAPVVSTVFLTEYYMKRNPYLYLRALEKVLFVLLIIDFFSILLFPSGLYHSLLYTDCWFLGYKTPRVRLVTMPIIMVSAILSLQAKNKLTGRFWIVAIIALLDTYLSKNGGGIVCILVFLGMLLCFYDSKHEHTRKYLLRIFNFKVLLTAVIAFTVIVNIFQNLSVFTPIMNQISEKSTSMMARTRIWTASLGLFEKKPLLGNGYILSSSFAELVGFPEATQPHSLFMSILVYTGIFGVLLFGILLNKALSYVETNERASTSVVCALYLICMLFHGAISMHIFAPFLYSSMIILYYLCDKKKVE